MFKVVVAGSANDLNAAVINFSNPASPSVVYINPNVGSGCQVNADGPMLAVGGYVSDFGTVQLFDLTNPAAPVTLGSINTNLAGIGAIAVQGSLVAVGENVNSFKARVMLIDISNPNAPVIKGTAPTPLVNITMDPTSTLGAIASVAFLNDNVVFVAGPAAPQVFRIDFTNPANPAVTEFSPILSTAATLDLDASANTLAVGDTGSGTIKLFNASTLAAINNFNSAISGITSLAVRGQVVVAAGPNDTSVTIVDFANNPITHPTIGPTGLNGGYTVAFDGSVCACGDLDGTKAALLNLSNPAMPSMLGTAANTTLASLGSLCITNFTPPSLVLSSAALNFGVVRIGQTSPLTLTLKNTGTIALSITAIASSNTVFTVSPTTLTPIAAGGSATLTVTFKPTAETIYSATLSFKTNDSAHPTVSVPMTGTGGLPHIHVPASLSLGSVAVCQSGSRTLSISNSGTFPLTISSIVSSSGQFTVSPANGTVAGMSNKSFTVTFTPTATGAQSGTLTVNSDDPNQPSINIPVTGTGTPTPPPSISVSPASLSFGIVPLQYFTGLRITVSNTSPCEALIVTPSTSGAPYFITATDPTTLPPTSVSLPAVTIPPNGSVRFVIVFSPTTAAATPGTLTLTSNDPANPTLLVALTGTGVMDSPAALELILDRSGSMFGAAPGGTKMDALISAVNLFADLLIPGQGDGMGSVQFDDQINVLTPFASYDTTQQAAIKSGADGLTPRNATCIGGALQLGQSQISGSSLARKILLVFTDGLENTPPMIATVEPAILAAGTEVYAIGLGQPQNISSAALQALAASANGQFFQTDDTLVLRKNFVQVLADAFRNNMNSDPIFTITPGQTINIPVQINQCEKRISFILVWDNPASNISLAIQAPDGTMYYSNSPIFNQLVRVRQQPAYIFYQIALPPIDPGSGLVIGPRQVGTWYMRVTGTSLSGTSERCSTSVILESDLQIKTSVNAADTSSALGLQVQLLHQGTVVPDAKIQVNLTRPTKSMAALSTPAVISRALNADQHPIPVGKRPLIPVEKTTHKLKFAEKTRAHLLNLAAPKIDGVYQFEIIASGQSCGGTFERYAAFSVYIGYKPDPKRTVITVYPAEQASIAVVEITPKNSAGKLLGVGQAFIIKPELRGKGTIFGLSDHFNGTYSFRVQWSPKVAPPVVLLKVGPFSKQITLGKKKTPGKKR
jgi:hypothetical protein